MDVSGDIEEGNYKFLAITIGTQESIEGLSNQIGRLPTHISGISGENQTKIISKLSFDGKNRKAFCIKLKRNEIVNSIKSRRKIKKRGLPTGSILRTYNYVVMQNVKKLLEQFLLQHGISITELIIQCDSDCIPFAKEGSLKHQYKGNAYRLSDIIAYCNNMEWPIPNVDEVKLTNDITERIMKVLKLK